MTGWRMAGWLGLVVAASTGAHARGAGEGTVAGPIGERVDRLLCEQEEKGFSGVALVAQGGRVLLHKGYGWADAGKQSPFRPDTAFDIGSVTKQFTAAAIVKLVEQGKVGFDDTLDRYFPDVPPGKRAITVHQLLTHTSGLPDAVGDDYEKLTKAGLLERAWRAELSSEPGKVYRYSNVGYSVLAAVIERASGKGYEEFLRANLFLPAGMNRTGYVLPDWPKEHLARGITRRGRDWGTPLDHPWDKSGPYWNLLGNGGMLSTAGDLYLWQRALERGTVLGKDGAARMFTPHVKEGLISSTHYGYGWSIAKSPRGTRVIEHNGGNGIFYANLQWFVDEKTLVVLASNDARHPAMRFEAKVADGVFSQQ